MSSEVVEELFEIVKNDKLQPKLRCQGWKYLLGLTASEESLDCILSSKGIIPFLLSFVMLPTEHHELLKLAHKCLINLSSTERGAFSLLSSSRDILRQLLLSIVDTRGAFVEDVCYVLSNLASHCGVVKDQDISRHLVDVLDSLWPGYDNADTEVRCRYKFLALFLANISKQSERRRLLLDDQAFLKRFIRHIDPAESDVRRLGVALTLRNLCMETDAHNRLLSETELLPVLLLPLMGPEEFGEEETERFPIDCQYMESSKERERVPQVRKALVQSLSLLCYSEKGWNSLKEAGVYAIARELHLWETDPDTKEAIETLVGFLLVIKYADTEKLVNHSSVVPSETDYLKDIPDFVL